MQWWQVLAPAHRKLTIKMNDAAAGDHPKAPLMKCKVQGIKFWQKTSLGFCRLYNKSYLNTDIMQ